MVANDRCPLLATHGRIVGRPRAALITVPAAGAGAAAHRSLLPVVAADVQLTTLRFAGRESRSHERPGTVMSELVAAVVDELVGSGPVGLPVTLLGECAGAHIAYELGRALTRRGAAPQRLVVLRQPSPSRLVPNRRTHALPDDQLLAHLVVTGAVATDVIDRPELFELFAGLLRADLELVESYAWEGPPADFPVDVFVAAPEFAARPRLYQAWEEVTSDEVTVRAVPDASLSSPEVGAALAAAPTFGPK